MINGAHAVIYSIDPKADRKFFRDVLGFPNVDIGRGWLIFGLMLTFRAVAGFRSPRKHHFGRRFYASRAARTDARSSKPFSFDTSSVTTRSRRGCVRTNAANSSTMPT